MDEIQLHAAPVRPLVQRLRNELRSVVHCDETGASSGPCQTVYLRVYHWTGDVNDCTNYDMTVSGTGSCTPTQIGASYCTSVANSSGNSATISAMGSVMLSDQNVMLSATGAPNDTVGLFFFKEF